MKKPLIIISFFLLLFSCSNETESDINETNKPLIQSIEYSEDNGLSFATFNYDSKGRLENKIDNSGNLSYQNFYLNNTDNQLQKTEYYNVDGSIDYSQNFQYDEQKNIIKRTTTRNNEITTETTYERNYVENTVKINFPSGIYLKHYLDSSNRPLKAEGFDILDGDDVYSLLYEIIPYYDPNGNITKLVTNSAESTSTAIFNYDNNKNPFQVLEKDFTNSDYKIDVELNYEPYPRVVSSNNYTHMQFDLTQLNNENISIEVINEIEYNDKGYPIKINRTQLGSSPNSTDSQIIINYQ